MSDDRLAEIKAHREEHGWTSKAWSDGAWLIAEVERLRRLDTSKSEAVRVRERRQATIGR